ncbi:MAG: ribosome-binding factor A [Candidatus Binatia bacterium]|nr:MAG: ribosome-binding factor A [Candidatus Binatia bacterium]
MGARRADRVADAVRSALAEILLKEAKDPRIGFVTLTEVRMSDDLRHARVYFSVLGDEEARRRSLEGLESAAPFLRREVGRRLRLRFAPEIVFRFDPRPTEAEHVARLLRGHPRDEEE